MKGLLQSLLVFVSLAAFITWFLFCVHWLMPGEPKPSIRFIDGQDPRQGAAAFTGEAMNTKDSLHHGFRFTVKGRWPFPFDMLREERATPDTTTDALTLETVGARMAQDAGTDFVIIFRKPGEEPDADKWAAHGWEVRLASELAAGEPR